MRVSRQPWIHSPSLDALGILLPPFLAIALAVLLPHTGAEVPLWAWVVFVLCVDVAHVYGTLFRTYFDRSTWRERKTLLSLLPLFCWLTGLLLYSMSAAFFWTALAYLAVFHFARQQYGFLALYTRNEPASWRKRIDQALVYLATLYPLVYWHTHPRNFHWFVDGDFFTGLPAFASPVAGSLYLCVLLAYIGKEIFFREGKVNIPKQLLLLGTMASWYVGIVLLNGDMAFTITNVVAHGIPYISLVWLLGRKQARANPERLAVAGLPFRRVYSLAFLPLFLGVLLLLAYLEEGLWDGFIWRDHLGFFSLFAGLPRLRDPGTLAWLVPLLSLPQSTHYVLDGFIWRLRDRKPEWSTI